MQPEQNNRLSVFDAFSQPTVFVQGGVVAYCNAAAKNAGLEPGQTEEACIQPGPMIQLKDKQVQADTYPFAGGTVYIAAQNWDGAPLGSDALLHIAQAIRAPLGDLLAVSPPMFLALEELENPSISRAMASLNRSFYQLLNLTCELTDASAAAHGTMTLAREKTDLGEFLQDIFEKAEPLCALCGAELSYDRPRKRTEVWIDEGKLRRAVYHLLTGAMKSSASGGKIRLSLIRSGRFAVIEVQDNGKSEGRMKTAMKALESAASAQLKLGENVGLAIAKAVAHAHGGTLVMTTNAVGITTAALSLSLAKPTAQELALYSSQERYDDTGGYRPELVALAGLLPAEVYDTINVN